MPMVSERSTSLQIRCAWTSDKPHMVRYHDREWGKPVPRDRKHFEMQLLECAQAGMMRETMLPKREGYRKAFAGFNPNRVAQFTAKTRLKLLQNPAIVRNRLKLDAAITNAKAFLAIQREFGSFDAYVYSFVAGESIVHCWKRMTDVPAPNPVSDMLSKDLKRRSLPFVGSTIGYAYVQAAGQVNDHVTTCFPGDNQFSERTFP